MNPYLLIPQMFCLSMFLCPTGLLSLQYDDSGPSTFTDAHPNNLPSLNYHRHESYSDSEINGGIIMLLAVVLAMQSLVVVVMSVKIRRDRNDIRCRNKSLSDLEKELSLKILDLQTLEYKFRELKNEYMELWNSSRQTISDKDSIINRSLSSQFCLLDELATKYYDVKGMATERNDMYCEIVRKMSGICHNKNIVSAFEKSVNIHLDNLMEDFRNDFPLLNEEEQLLFLLSVLNFSAKSICIFCDISTTKVYNRRAALRKKIMVHNPEAASRYMRHV